MNIKNTIIGTGVVLGLVFSASTAFAHVTVSPNEVGAAQRVNFAVGVPTEEDVPTVGLRLIIPEGLTSVTPNVKPGWQIEVKKSGEGEAARVTEVIWTGGEIPAGQRDEFIFRAMAPATETELPWKAYQTYEGSKIVSWDADPKVVEEYEKNNSTQHGEHDDKAPLPYSVTKVINDLAVEETNGTSSTSIQNASQTNPLMTGGVVAALIMSAGALYLAAKKKK